MALVSFLDLIRHARQHRYALSVISVGTLTELSAALDAAQNQRAPILLAPTTADTVDFKALALFSACETAARHSTVPVAMLGMQKDSAEQLTGNINLGCMALHVVPEPAAFPDVVARTKALVQVAKQCGIAAGGLLQDYDSARNASSAELRTPVAESVAFAERAELDFLEVQIGAQTGGGSGRARIDFERLKRIHEATGLPLLTRSDSALAPEQVQRLREHGVTLVCHDITPGKADLNGIMSLLNAWGSSGRAAEVLEHCKPWQLVEHVIEFNVQAEAFPNVDEMLRLGREQLAVIPGVRRVVTGKALINQAKYRFCWIVTFSNRKVVDYYRDHPIHVEFANAQFRPIATDRITIDFEH